MRRLFPLLPEPALLGAALVVVLLSASSGAVTAGAAGVAGSAQPTVRAVIGAQQLETPSGLALDTAGDLFVADTGHCRVLVLPAHSAFRYGRQLRAGCVATVAGGSCTGAHTMGRPTGLAVDLQGDLYVAEATAQRVQEIRPGGTAGLFTVAGTGHAGDASGVNAIGSQLNQPTSVAVDGSGDLFIADTANCRLVAVPHLDTALFGKTARAGQLTTVAGTGVCGTTGQGGPAGSAELWDPGAVAVDSAGDLLVADSGDQSVLLVAATAGTYLGLKVGAGDIAVVAGGTGGYGSYLADGLPAAGPTAELNDPRGVAVTPAGQLFVTDGFMHALRVVPSASGTVLGRAMTVANMYTAAGAVPVQSAAGGGDGTRWVLTHLGTPTGVAVAPSGTIYVADAARDDVLAINTGGGS